MVNIEQLDQSISQCTKRVRMTKFTKSLIG